MPPPPLATTTESEENNNTEGRGLSLDHSNNLVLGNLPASCLLSYYESRRRWIYGGFGPTCKNNVVNGVHQTTSSHKREASEESDKTNNLLVLAGCGAQRTNVKSVEQMGEYAVRLMNKPIPLVGDGSSHLDGRYVGKQSEQREALFITRRSAPLFIVRSALTHNLTSTAHEEAPTTTPSPARFSPSRLDHSTTLSVPGFEPS